MYCMRVVKKLPKLTNFEGSNYNFVLTVQWVQQNVTSVNIILGPLQCYLHPCSQLLWLQGGGLKYLKKNHHSKTKLFV
jgi:hypothetical protein